MSQKIESLTIRDFSGISVRVNATDQPPGTMHVADGCNTVPSKALSFGPNWASAWGQSTLATAIATALSGAPSSEVDFVTLTRSGYTFLIAWEITAARPRGIFHVAGISDPTFSASSGSSVTAPNDTIYRHHTNSLPWYGSWVQNELWLGNGTDTNLVWASSALAVLGPATTPTNPQDPSQSPFPPCKTFLVGDQGQVYAAGNTTYPLRVWCGEIPNIDFPLNRGMKTTAYSYLDLQTNATSITGLSSVGVDLVVHLNIGPPMIIAGYRGGPGGWKLVQKPTQANAGAINPNTTRDTKLATTYLGSDLEFYRIATYKGSIVDRQYDAAKWRKEDIVTDASAGTWNQAATKPISGTDYAMIYDEKNARTWAWLTMSAGARLGVFCWEDRTDCITGPWRYPDFLSVCKLRTENLNGTLVCGITRDGAFLYSDVASIGDFTPPAFTTALPAACAGVLTPPTATTGIGYVGVDEVNSKFVYVLNGQTLYLTDPWGDWAASGSVTPTVYYNNSRLAIIEFAETDAGSASMNKEWLMVRSTFDQNSICYVGVYANSGGRLYGAWRGLMYPSTDWLSAIGGESSTTRIRLIIVSFNSFNGVLSGLRMDYLPAVAN